MDGCHGWKRTGTVYDKFKVSKIKLKKIDLKHCLSRSSQTYAIPGNIPKSEERQLDETGINFVKKCIEVIESRGLEEQGLYRIVGVNSKVNKLLSMVLDRRKADKLNLDDVYEWESKTLTSALKNFLRNLPEPLMTYKLHDSFIEAASESESFIKTNKQTKQPNRMRELCKEVFDFVVGVCLFVCFHE